MTIWYYRLGKMPAGPVSFEKLVELMKSGTIRSDTLLWHSGLGDWRTASEIEELTSPFTDAVIETPITQRDPALAGPWRRFWARLFDMAVVSIAFVTPAGYLSRSYLPGVIPMLDKVNEVLPGFLVLPTSGLILAIVMALFGTTPGKAIAGVKVENISGRPPLHFYLLREFRLWIFANAAGIPFISMVTNVLQYRQVASGRPARYDKGIATVKGSASAGRLWVVAILTLSMFGAVGYSNMPEFGNAVTLADKTWINPATGKKTLLAAAWTFEELKAEYGRLFYFAADTLKAQALLGYEPMEELDIDPVAYGEALQEAIGEELAIDGEWMPMKINGLSAARAKGVQKKVADTNVEVTVIIMGRSAWRVILFARGQPVSTFPNKELLIHSLLWTAKDINVPTSMPCEGDSCFSFLPVTGRTESS